MSSTAADGQLKHTMQPATQMLWFGVLPPRGWVHQAHLEAEVVQADESDWAAANAQRDLCARRPSLRHLSGVLL